MFRLTLALVLVSFLASDALACGGSARRMPVRTILSHLRPHRAGSGCQPGVATQCGPVAIPAPMPAPKPEPPKKHHHESAAPVVPAVVPAVNTGCDNGTCANGNARPRLFRLFR